MTQDQFAEWLTRQLRRREWSGADLSRRMGSGNSTVTMWLNGYRMPSPASAERLADVLGIDLDVVLAQAGHRPLEPDIDPESPEAVLLPLIRRINWTTDPRRLESVERDLRWFIDLDQREKQ